MTPEKLKSILRDARKLAAAVADPEVLPLLPVTPDTVRFLPIQLTPWQAKWLFGNCTDEHLATMREVRPAIVAQKFNSGFGTRYRYSKIEVCKAVPVQCDEAGGPTGKSLNAETQGR